MKRFKTKKELLSLLLIASLLGGAVSPVWAEDFSQSQIAESTETLADLPEFTETPELPENPEPTQSPEPTNSPEPADGEEPTVNPQPTAEEKPTESPEPTKSPEPTQSPESTDSLESEERTSLDERVTELPQRLPPYLLQEKPMLLSAALRCLENELALTIEQIGEELEKEGEYKFASLSYEGGSVENYINLRTVLVGAFALRSGLSPEILAQKELNTDQLQLLRGLFWQMVQVKATLTEKDIDQEEADKPEIDREEAEISEADQAESNTTKADEAEAAQAESGNTEATQVESNTIEEDKEEADNSEIHKTEDDNTEVKKDEATQEDANTKINRELAVSVLFHEEATGLNEDAQQTLYSWLNGDMRSVLAQAAVNNACRETPVQTLQEDVVRTALSMCGQITYQWGGKYNRRGGSAYWNLCFLDKEDELDAYGLDCSGFVTWVLINAAGTEEALAYIGEGTSSQRSHCRTIGREEVCPGDLAFIDGGGAEFDHVGIVTAVDRDGVQICHCSGGGVIVSQDREMGELIYRRPEQYYEVCGAKAEKPKELVLNEYAKAEEGSLFLLTIADTPPAGSIWSWDGTCLRWSPQYNAWCTIIPYKGSMAVLEEEIQQNFSVLRCTGREFSGTGDSNLSGKTDINDVQFIYAMYRGEVEHSSALSSDTWLHADRNVDRILSMEDVQLAAMNLAG